jgi:hypothetical protein
MHIEAVVAVRDTITAKMATARRSLALAMVAVGLSCRPTGGDSAQMTRVHVARITGETGAVDVLHTGAGDWTRASAGEALFEDDRVRTFKGAWAQLTFDEGSSLRVDEESLITLGGGITVERGSVAGELQAGLHLKTPALEAESVAPRDIVFR